MDTTSRTPSHTLFRILRWTLAIFLAVLVFELMSWNFLKGPITDRVEAMTGRDMEISGDVSVSLLPRPQLEVGEMKLLSLNGEGSRQGVIGESQCEISPKWQSDCHP